MRAKRRHLFLVTHGISVYEKTETPRHRLSRGPPILRRDKRCRLLLWTCRSVPAQVRCQATSLSPESKKWKTFCYSDLSTAVCLPRATWKARNCCSRFYAAKPSIGTRWNKRICLRTCAAAATRRSSRLTLQRTSGNARMNDATVKTTSETSRMAE